MLRFLALLVMIGKSPPQVRLLGMVSFGTPIYPILSSAMSI
jgi:hypothetical protein